MHRKQVSVASIACVTWKVSETGGKPEFFSHLNTPAASTVKAPVAINNVQSKGTYHETLHPQVFTRRCGVGNAVVDQWLFASKFQRTTDDVRATSRDHAAHARCDGAGRPGAADDPGNDRGHRGDSPDHRETRHHSNEHRSHESARTGRAARAG